MDSQTCSYFELYYFLQNSVNAFDVNCTPWLLCKISSPVSWAGNLMLFSRFLLPNRLLLRSVILAITLLSCKSIIVQLYRTSLFARNKYVKSVHHLLLISLAVKSWFSLLSNVVWAFPYSYAGFWVLHLILSPVLYSCTYVLLKCWGSSPALTGKPWQLYNQQRRYENDICLEFVA